MRSWKFEDALTTLERMGLTGSNLAVAQYWLSLWQGDRPPTRSAFNPARIAKRLPAVALIQVREGETAVFKLAGHWFRLATGIELTGKNMLALTPKLEQAERIRNTAAIVQGAIFCATRPFLRDDGAFDMVQEICLPFADRAEDGTRRYLLHSDWQPQGDSHRISGLPRTDTSIPKTRVIEPIRHRSA